MTPEEKTTVASDLPKALGYRGVILEEAIRCVCQDRNDQYGEPEDVFALIANLWSVYLEHDVSAHDVGMMMALLKIARIKDGRFKADSYIDAAGYIACAAEIAK